MCTAMTLQTNHGGVFLGRTMDFSYPLNPELYIVPRGYGWNNILNTHQFQNSYRFIGIGQDISPVVFADGVNELGFSAAALYFPGYASYDPLVSENPGLISIAAIELVSFLLGFCASVEHAASLLGGICIVGTTDPVTQSVAPLHWMIADRSGKCSVIEKTADGLHLMDNPIGVLSNSPDFTWHITNLRNYMNVSPYQLSKTKWGPLDLTPFGQGAGTFGLPGDYTPPSRFVRTAYHKSHVPTPSTDEEAIISFFHIMDSVSIPKGSVITSRQTPDYTQYTALMNLTLGEYYFNTYDNSQLTTAALRDHRCQGDNMVSLGKLDRPVEFQYL